MITVAQKTQLIPIGAIRPYFRNPRKSDKTVDALVKLIPQFGFNVPIVLDQQNIIVKGHSRWRAAIRLGMTQLPCIYSEADDETNKLDRIADNKVQEFSSWEQSLLDAELARLGIQHDLAAVLDFDLGPAFGGNEPEALSAEEPDDSPEEESEINEPATSPSSGDAEAAVAVAEARDVADHEGEFDEIVCDKCGTRLRVPRED